MIAGLCTSIEVTEITEIIKLCVIQEFETSVVVYKPGSYRETSRLILDVEVGNFNHEICVLRHLVV